MTVIDTRLSPRVEAGFSVVPMWNTRVTTLRNGHERRNARMTLPKHRYTARYGRFTRADREEMLAVAMATLGQTYGFRFKDHNDYTATAQPLVEVNGVWYLSRLYTFGALSLSRTITKPVEGTVALSGGSLANLDYATGIYDGDGTGLTWTGEFDVPVRFATDEVEFVLPHRDIAEVHCELVEVFGE
jgi:uncharacterized protein (TIGR02217 family)